MNVSKSKLRLLWTFKVIKPLQQQRETQKFDFLRILIKSLIRFLQMIFLVADKKSMLTLVNFYILFP